jgi:hypothetical protein
MGQGKPGFHEGELEGKKVASTLGDMSAVLNILSVQTPPAPKQSDGSGPVSAEAQAEFEEAYRLGYSVAIATTVVKAQEDNPRPRLRLIKFNVHARGECLFKAVRFMRDEDPAACRETVIDNIASMWNEPCSAGVAWRGHVSRTVGEALQEEHGRTFKDGAEWAAWMRTRNASGGVPWSTAVEIQELANLLSAIIRVWIPTRDGGLALRDYFFPSGGPTTPIIDIFYACGHFDGLVPLDSLSPDHAGKAMAVSESAWDEARLAAAAASIGFLAGLGLANLAEESAGGPAQLEALARAAAEAEVARALEAGAVPHEVARDMAVGIVAKEAGSAPSKAVALLADGARLRRAVSAFLVPATADSAAVEADVIPELVSDDDDDIDAPAAVPAAFAGRAADVEVRHPPPLLLPHPFSRSKAHPSPGFDGPAPVKLPDLRCTRAWQERRSYNDTSLSSRVQSSPPSIHPASPASPVRSRPAVVSLPPPLLPRLPKLTIWHVCALRRRRVKRLYQVVLPRRRTRVPRIRLARGP